MGLSLTSTAAPDLVLGALDVACRARGLDGLELVLDATEAPEEVAARAIASGARVVALRAETLDTRTAPALARAAARLHVPLSVPADTVAGAALEDLAAVFAEHGARLLLAHGTNLAQTVGLTERLQKKGLSRSVGLAWELRPSTERLDDAGAVLFAGRELLGLVRLFGGGPEQSEQDGLGIGPLLVDLALSRYTGPIVVCPSSPAQLPRWRKWLASQRSAGCGTRAGAKEVFVDVREVEPRDRLDTILGAYRTLGKGATLRLTVDHDPSCMAFMLEATEPAGSYAFETLEHGPEIWRAAVRKA